jgi:hypothetical protein
MPDQTSCNDIVIVPKVKQEKDADSRTEPKILNWQSSVENGFRLATYTPYTGELKTSASMQFGQNRERS